MKIQRWIKNLAVAALVGVTTSMVACNKGGGGDEGRIAGTPSPANHGIANCQGCQSLQNGTTLLSVPAKGGTSFPVTFQLNIIADNQIMQQIAQAGWSVQKTYSGPIYMSGTMTVAANTYAGYCQIPAGTYQLGTLQVGQMQMGTFMVSQVEAVGPTRLVFSIGPAVVVDPDGNGVVDRIGGQIYFMQGPAMTYGASGPSNIGNCADYYGVYLN
jgi:hypothetical protein